MEQISSLRHPPLLIGDRSEVSLRSIARGAMTRAPEVAESLLDEVDRADVITESEVPEDVVSIGSFVTYRVGPRGSVNTIQLVSPHEADLSHRRVSIVSAIGAGLIGLSAGQQIEWPLADKVQLLEVLRVAKPSLLRAS